MKKIIYIILFLFISSSMTEKTLAESELAKKIWGDRDCSQYSTKTFAGLSKYKKCKDGLDPEQEESFFQSLKWKGKKNEEFDFNKPCDEYSTKTFSGLAKKMKCKRAKKQ